MGTYNCRYSIVGLLPGLLFMWSGFAYASWRCPRCQKPIHLRGWFVSDIFARKCTHCTLRIGADPNSESNEKAKIDASF